MSDDINAKADALIADLLMWTRRLNVPEFEENLKSAAHGYYRSLLWKTIPFRFPDSIDCPPVSGEFEAK